MSIKELGCPISRNAPACWRCQGWFRSYDERLLRKAVAKDMLPAKLCDVLTEQVKEVIKMSKVEPETKPEAKPPEETIEPSLASKVTGIPDDQLPQLPKGGVNADRGGVVPDRIG